MRFVLRKPVRLFTRTFGQTHHSYPMEGILRPALELNSAVVAGCTALPFIVIPEFFLMSQFYGFIIGGVLAGFAVRRLAQGLWIVQYKLLIKAMPTYQISIKKFYQLMKPGKVFFGVGFRWKNQHTQRFYDLETVTDFNQKYLSTKRDILGGKPHLHGVGASDEKEFYLTLDDRIGHMLIYGQSRVGKSRALELLLEQDIFSGECVFLLDPKGDKDLFKRTLVAARRANRLHQIRIVHLGFPDSSIAYNPIASYQKVAEVATRISTKLPSAGDSQAFSNFAWRFIYLVAQALGVLKQSITPASIKRHILELDNLLFDYACYISEMTAIEFQSALDGVEYDEENIERQFQGRSECTVKIIKYFENGDKDDVLQGLISAFSYEKTYYDKITASLLPFLEKLTTCGDMVSPGEGRALPELDLEASIADKHIVVFLMDGMSDPEIAKAVGSMFFADLVSMSGKRYKTEEEFEPIWLHADEFNDVVGDDFMPLLNKAGGAGVRCTLYTQTDDDIEVGFGGSNAKSKALVLKGNFRTIATMRVGTEETANYFTQRLNEVTVKYTTQSTRFNDSNSAMKGESASTADEIKTEKIRLIDTPAITSIPVGQMFVSVNGGQIFKTRLPLLTEDLTQEVGNIKQRGLGNMIRDVNLGQFIFADQLSEIVEPEEDEPLEKNKIFTVNVFENEQPPEPEISTEDHVISESNSTQSEKSKEWAI